VDSLKENFLPGVEANFFIHFWASSSNENLLSFKEFIKTKKFWKRLHKKNRYRLIYEEYVQNRMKINESFPTDPAEIQKVAMEAYQPKGLVVENQKDFDTSDFNRQQQNVRIRTGETRPKDVLSMFYGICEANKLRHKFQQENEITYDCVIRCRSDLFFHKSFDIRPFKEMVENYVILPDTHNWRDGKNDQLAISSPENMNIYCQAYDSIRSYYNLGGIFHPETFLSWYLEKNDILCCHVPIGYDIVRGAWENPSLYLKSQEEDGKVGS
jgi:hypothetical protein